MGNEDQTGGKDEEDREEWRRKGKIETLGMNGIYTRPNVFFRG